MAIGSVIVLGGCDLDRPSGEDLRTDAAYGRDVFEQNCVVCHGQNGKGQGMAASRLAVNPPDLTQLSRQNEGVFPRNAVMSAIDGFGRKEHRQNPMPVFGNDGLGPTILIEEDGLSTPIPANLLALANYIESIQN